MTFWGCEVLETVCVASGRQVVQGTAYGDVRNRRGGSETSSS